jgi:hypothetical protein
VNPALAGVALAVVAGGIVAVSAHDARTVVLGLAIALILSPIVAEPIPDAVGLGARWVGAVLASYLMWVAARGHRAGTTGSLVGWPTEVFLAIAAAAVGYGSHGLYATGTGPAAAAAAGCALCALAVVPIVNGRDILRISVGLGLLLTGAGMIVTGATGAPTSFEQLLMAGLIATFGGAIALLITSTRAVEPVDDGRPG